MTFCIIIPMYNESQRFDAESLLDFDSKYAVDFLLVNDGSTDDTQAIIDTLANKDTRISVLHLKDNSGKAEAVRQGALNAIKNKSYDAIGYLDADFATPLFEIDQLINVFSINEKSLIIGSRIKRLGASIKRFRYRHLAGRIIATIISEYILKLPVYDTQCGAKLISKKHITLLFDTPFVSNWLFDVELIARLAKHHDKDYCYNQIYELPLRNWEDKGNSKITLFDMFKVPFELLKIYWHYK